MFITKPTKIQGCFELQPKVNDDARGRFVKLFHETMFEELGLETRFVEEYYSVSRKNVVRGMHFQKPPMDHVKIVCCLQGEAMDVVVDLRIGSPTYGQHVTFELSAAKANSVYVPKGMAHGFCALSENTVMLYKVSTVYSSEHDSGVLWDSLGISWTINEPIVSARDSSFLKFKQFKSPFYL